MTPPNEQMVAAASTEFPPLDYGKEYISKERQWEHSGQHKGFIRCWERYVVPLRAENERLRAAVREYFEARDTKVPRSTSSAEADAIAERYWTRLESYESHLRKFAGLAEIRNEAKGE